MIIFSRQAKKTERARLSIPKPEEQLGTMLLDLQAWSWGRDVCYPEQNLLIAYGFQRIPLPEGSRGHSNYVLYSDPHRQVMVWGFGLFYGVKSLGGLFLKRYQFRPRWIPFSRLSPPICQSADIGAELPCSAEQIRNTTHLLSEAMQWLADYETWILQTAGLAYRQQVLEGWPKRKKHDFPVETVVPGWQQLAQHFATERGSLGSHVVDSQIGVKTPF